MSEKQNVEQDTMLLTHHVFNNKKKEMSVMKHFRYKYPTNEPELPESDLDEMCNEKLVKERHQTLLNKTKLGSVQSSSQFLRLDNKASVVNGKLVYIDTKEQPLGKNRHQLMRLLKQNGISYKQYLLGDKQKINRQIAEHTKQKQVKLLKEYVDKHINMQKTTKIEFIQFKTRKRIL